MLPSRAGCSICTLMIESGIEIAPAEGPLGVLLPGLGAVSSTFIAGVCLVNKGLGLPIGSLTQMGTIRLGKRTDDRAPFIRDFVPLAGLSDLRFCAWDIFPDNAYASARKAEVVAPELLEKVRPELESIVPHTAVFDQSFIKNLDGPNKKTGKNKRDLAEQVIADIDAFRDRSGVSRMVMVWCGSTESFQSRSAVHQSLAEFERGLESDDPSISPSMIYAYAALQCGVPFANGAPNLTVDVPAMLELASKRSVPICGKDFKTGQTLMKTIIAPGLKARLLGLHGWFSTNILGNRDGEVLEDPGSFKTKEESKLSVLDVILRADLHPDLYRDFVHKVAIHYYPPRGDNKEGWDNIDVFGWLGYPMQIKVNFLCRDSILAAPLVLDLALFLDLAQRCGMKGIQEWLSFYFKSPQTAEGLYPEHDLFIQLMKLKNTLRHLRGEDLITHLGLEYYD
jgi:myo-inositol-1-phosphate synthase